MENEKFLDTVLELYYQNSWIKIINLNEHSHEFYARKVLWVWPSVQNLKFLKNNFEKYKVQGVTSIGCGSGLLEWIINKYTNYDVIGIEINEEWWTSKHSVPQFIQVTFISDLPNENLLNPNYCLLFCYFNCGEAFRQYIKCYRGYVVIIIGPGDGCGRHTDPEPFKVNFGDSNWKLAEFQEVRDTKDYIAFYIRQNNKLIYK